jgi:hypothetical protein
MHNSRRGCKYEVDYQSIVKSGRVSWKRQAEVNTSRAPTRSRDDDIARSPNYHLPRDQHFSIDKMSAGKPEASADANGSDAADLAKVCSRQASIPSI